MKYFPLCILAKNEFSEHWNGAFAHCGISEVSTTISLFERDYFYFFRQLNAIQLVDVSRNKEKRVAQYFDYLLVLDFEATCWPLRTFRKRENEVIEFSVVLYDVNEGRIIDEFQQYVQPTEFPILSEFCTELTGRGWSWSFFWVWLKSDYDNFRYNPAASRRRSPYWNLLDDGHKVD